MNKIIILIMLITLTGCAGTRIKYVNPAIFIDKAKTIEGSATWYTYIGKSKNRIYLEEGSVITSGRITGLSKKPSVTIYWTELGQIPDSVVNELEIQKLKYLVPKPGRDWDINKKLDIQKP
ncbi:MAG: hypothetical protein V1709_01090 [Planctomycetota bacterium]